MSKHGAGYLRDFIPPRSRYFDKGRFGRMFGSLPPFSSDNPLVRKSLLELGKKGGIMDAGDDLTKTPKELILNPGTNLDNPAMTAGMTFLGQFLDHDMTFDPTSSLERQADPESISNFRTPSFGLDSVYGSGPDASPHLYDQSQPGKLLIEKIDANLGNSRYDLPRNSQGVALIGDPRNDENLIISQLQLAFLRFHNEVIDLVAAAGISPGQRFEEAQRLVRWHYQWIILHEFLPLTIGAPMVADILTNGRKFYTWRNEPFIPVEFSTAAYRFGHSQIRPSYRANFDSNQDGVEDDEFFAFIFTANSLGQPDPDDLSGGRRAIRRYIDWRTFFDFKDGKMRNNKMIDVKLSSPLFELPGSVVAHPDPMLNPQSLAQRNLLRHLTFSLPSGQRVAQAMNLPVADAADFADLKPLNLHNNTPLWFYILREAERMEGGKHLGPVGGRIVGEVFIGLLQGDKGSYLSQDPDWRPSLPTIDSTLQGSDFRIVDLLRFAKVA